VESYQNYCLRSQRAPKGKQTNYVFASTNTFLSSNQPSTIFFTTLGFPGNIIGDLNSRRGIVNELGTRSNLHVVNASVARWRLGGLVDGGWGRQKKKKHSRKQMLKQQQECVQKPKWRTYQEDPRSTYMMYTDESSR